MSLLIWKMTDIHFECIYSHIVFDISFGTDEFVFIIVYIFVVSGSVRFFGVHHDFGLANICAGCRAHSSGVPLRVEMAGTEEKSTDWVRSQEVSEPLQWVLKSFYTFDFFFRLCCRDTCQISYDRTSFCLVNRESMLCFLKGSLLVCLQKTGHPFANGMVKITQVLSSACT